MVLKILRWIGKGCFTFYSIIAFIGIFYQNQYFYWFELPFTLLSIIFMFWISVNIYFNPSQFQSANVNKQTLFLSCNVMWGFLSILYVICKITKLKVINIFHHTLILSTRSFQIILFVIWLFFTYQKIPDDKSSKSYYIYKAGLIINLFSITYYLSEEIVWNIFEQIRNKTNNNNTNSDKSILKRFQNYENVYETFFYSFCILSILLLLNRLKRYSSNPIPKEKPNFYHFKNYTNDDIRKLKQSLVAIIISVSMLIATIYITVENILSFPVKLRVNLSFISSFYTCGLISYFILLLEMKNWMFTETILSRIDKQIQEIGTIGQLIYATSIVISTIILINEEKENIDTKILLITYLLMVIDLCAQRSTIIQILKMKYGTRFETNNSMEFFILQFCPSMILSTMNFCLIPISYIYLARSFQSETVECGLNATIWIVFKYAKAPVLILHRFHGFVVYGYNLYQTW